MSFNNKHMNINCIFQVLICNQSNFVHFKNLVQKILKE